MCKAQTPEMLHGPRLRGIGLWVEGGAGFDVHQQAADVAPTQLDRQHEAAWPAACDEDIDCESWGHERGVQLGEKGGRIERRRR